ncbi:MAG: hypothetical protein AAB590_01650 [Patescibacteria group bacterium]
MTEAKRDTPTQPDSEQNAEEASKINSACVALQMDSARFPEYMERKVDRSLHSKIALKLISIRKTESLILNLGLFKELDHEVAIKLCEVGLGWEVVANLEKFKIDDSKVLALKLIETGQTAALAAHMEKFMDLDHQEIASRMIEAGGGLNVIRYSPNFRGLTDATLQVLEKIKRDEEESSSKPKSDHGSESASQLLSHPKDYPRVLAGIDSALHRKTALELIYLRDSENVLSNLGYFKNLDPREVITELLKEKQSHLILKHLERFKGIDLQEVIIKLIEIGRGEEVVDHLTKLPNVNKAIAFKLIEKGFAWAVARNLEKLPLLNHQEIAAKMIETGQGQRVYLTLEKFKGLDAETLAKIETMK